ncbi:unnamed protein product [Brassica rapa]|uniref:Uncharacterized protein n=2 Tax=Brassica TaxID=3705 RepID=A0A3P6B694_BRACM|nr:unnamed protein product [Brassica napus]CAG7895320.1 unnamed protein product [Brassica rapa]CDY48984.1 BnaA02g28120D [Brassica napus]CDY48985.1 BnaA02g28110D [Brassica napus]CDY48986.1 BnaA02g28100D [Brassica napus]
MYILCYKTIVGQNYIFQSTKLERIQTSFLDRVESVCLIETTYIVVIIPMTNSTKISE